MMRLSWACWVALATLLLLATPTPHLVSASSDATRQGPRSRPKSASSAPSAAPSTPPPPPPRAPSPPPRSPSPPPSSGRTLDASNRHPRRSPKASSRRHSLPPRPATSPQALDIIPPPPETDTSDATHGPARDDAPIKLSAASLEAAEDYIVKLRSSLDPEEIHAFVERFNQQAGLPKGPRPRGVNEASAASVSHPHPNCVRRFLDPQSYRGVVVRLTRECLVRLQRRYRNDIAYVERNGRLTLAAVQNPSTSWGLSRISSLRRNLTAPYYYPDSAGFGTRIFVIDTGIQANHTEFATGRARQMVNFVEGEANTDLDGHGTHVAATIAGRRFGVAKRGWIYGVKVLDRTRSGTYADIVAGIQYCIARVLRGKTLINISISGPVSQAVNDALNAAVAAGIVVIGAAGNDGQPACNYSPASASRILAVGATNTTDARATFSNYGPCVKLFAPGENIRSAWAFGSRSNTGTAFMSGTSQAAPHVTGIAALYMSMYTYPNVDTVYEDLIQAGNWNVLRGASLLGSPNVLAFNYQDPTMT